jgi:hypothetical protein
MPLLFQSKVGAVVALDDPAVQCTTYRPLLDMRETPIDFQTHRAIVTRITVSQQVNVQFLHALGSLIYVYVFGDRMGKVSLAGLSFFMCECDPNACGPAGPRPDSGNDIYQWYKENRASKREAPVRLTVGTQVIEGFVTSFAEDVVDPSTSLLQWSVNMDALPEDDDVGLADHEDAAGGVGL